MSSARWVWESGFAFVVMGWAPEREPEHRVAVTNPSPARSNPVGAEERQRSGGVFTFLK
jgi:hypothetical protein